MALDFSLIKQSTEYSISQIDKRISTECPYVFLLENFLDPLLIEKLYKYITTADNWVEQEDYHPGDYQNNRLKINWESDTVIEEAHVVFENLTDAINQIYKRNNKFVGINLWKDINGYQIPRHADNPDIDIAMQIYLNSEQGNLGTKFEYQDVTIETPYSQNCGYIMDNEGKIIHYFDSAIPPNYVRYSIYAIWTKIQ